MKRSNYSTPACLLIALCVFVASKLFAAPVAIDGVCNVYFSPRGGVAASLVQFIGSAKGSVRVLAYNLTSGPVSNALIAAHKRGIDVQIVVDRSVPYSRKSALPELLAAGVPTYIDRKHKIAHNKTIVIDGEWFETGSFNFTDNAELYNGENALICPSKQGAQLYGADWEKHKLHSEVAK